MLHLPLLNFKISLHSLIQQIRPVTIQRFGQGIQCIHLVRIKPETDSLLLHITLSYHGTRRNIGATPKQPDCEALRRMDNGRMQRVLIEFEFESKNFLDHMHDPSRLDTLHLEPQPVIAPQPAKEGPARKDYGISSLSFLTDSG